MPGREVIQFTVAGHEMRMTAEAEEKELITRASTRVNDAMAKMQKAVGGTMTPTKMAIMVAVQFAYDLALADEMLSDAERLHEELKRQKSAVSRLESLLSRVDDALAY